MIRWTAKGNDSQGADTYEGDGTDSIFLITDHKVGGIKVYQCIGSKKELQSQNFKDVAGAKTYVDRMCGAQS